MPHGITINETTAGPSRIAVSDTAIALIGIAPEGSTQTLVELKNKSDDTVFGKDIDGYTIPQALRAIRANSPYAKVVVINVADASHYVDGPVETFTDVQIPVAGGAAQLASGGNDKYQKSGTTPVLTNLAKTVTYVEGTDYSIDSVGAITVINAVAMPDGTDILANWTSWKVVAVSSMEVTLDYAPKSGTLVVKPEDGTAIYTEGTDYTVDEYGVVTIILGGSITEGDRLSFEYERLDASAVVSGDIVGVATPGAQTGIGLLDTCLVELGYNPNIILVPVWNQTSGVWQAMETWADTYQGLSLVDAPAGALTATVVANRGPLTANNFNTANPRVVCCYPQLYLPNLRGGSYMDYLWEFSSFLAGVMAETDATDGYQRSPSNKPVKGHAGAERNLTWLPGGTGGETQSLNDVGVVTLKIFNGISVWGNTNASYPSVTDGTHFIAPRRTYDIIQNAIRLATVEFLGQPLNSALIDDIKQKINNFINSQIGQGALIVGSECTYDPAKNPPADLAAGILRLDIRAICPSPAENIIFNFTIDNSLLDL